jgi:exodeoxyribonuclease VII small subunit
MSETTELTFENGYERLQTIAGRLNEEEVPVSEMCDLYAEGKGLEQALTRFLDAQRSRVEAIERGEGIQAFRITSAGEAAAKPAEPAVLHPPAPQQPTLPADDEIPF